VSPDVPDPRRVFCTTLGCDKNIVDSEALLGRFHAAGFDLSLTPEDAGIWILNTCGFIAAARADSDDALAQMARQKGSDRVLAVFGCWAQEHGAAIRERYPQVDLVGGVGQFDELIAACGSLAHGDVAVAPETARYPGMEQRVLLTPGHVAFVKIGEGCDCACTFCRIPMIRGGLRSRSADEIVREVRGLAEEGVTEIQLVSQNTSHWGRDLGDDLLSLVGRLDGIDGLRRIRLLYLYAGLTSAEQALRLLDHEKVVPYLDAPIQHASRRLLAAMKRPGNSEVTAGFFAALRERHPEIVLRTTVLLGFPGETEQDVEELAEFLARVQFDHLGAYRYSPEEGTSAARLPGRVPDEEIADREARILDLQAEISLDRQRARLGKQFEILVDRVGAPHDIDAAEVLAALADGVWSEKPERATLADVLDSGDPVAVGRSYHFGFDLDGVVLLPAGELAAGQWIRADFAAVTPFDAWARITGRV